VAAHDTQQLRSRCGVGPVVDGESHVVLRVATNATTREPETSPASRATGRRAAHAIRHVIVPTGRSPWCTPGAEGTAGSVGSGCVQEIKRSSAIWRNSAASTGDQLIGAAIGEERGCAGAIEPIGWASLV
jgi:hypothetical protein